jgi:hypothetical protein
MGAPFASHEIHPPRLLELFFRFYPIKPIHQKQTETKHSGFGLVAKNPATLTLLSYSS